MKKSVIAGMVLMLAGSLFAGTYYLQADMTLDKENNKLSINEIWFSERSDGGEHPERITGNVFAVNGKKWRTGNTSKLSRFPGTFLVDNAGAGTGELMAAEWQPAVMKFEKTALMRLRRSNVTLLPDVMSITADGAAEFRTHSDGSTTLKLNPGRLEGSGRLQFGKYKLTDPKGLWSFTSKDTAGFTGSVALEYGMLTIEDPLDFSGASFSINAQNEAVLFVDEVQLKVKSLTIDGKAIAAGTYSPKELAKEVGSPCLKGFGKIIVLK